MKKIILKVLALFFISFTSVLAGCGSSPGDKFLGTWSDATGENLPFETYLVIEKNKNSDSYILTQYTLSNLSHRDWTQNKDVFIKDATKNIYNLTPDKDKLSRDWECYFYIDNAGELRANVGYGKEGYKRISDKALTFEEMNKGRGYPDPDKKK